LKRSLADARVLERDLEGTPAAQKMNDVQATVGSLIGTTGKGDFKLLKRAVFVI